MSGRGVLSGEQAIDDQSRMAPAAQATPPWYHVDWDAHQAAAEESASDTMAWQTAQRSAALDDAAQRLAKLRGQPFDSYYIGLGGTPAGFAPTVDTNRLYADLAALPPEQRKQFDIGNNPQEFEAMMRERGRVAAAERERRMAKGGALGNFGGGMVGGFANPITDATLPIGGFGRGVAMKIATEALTQAGIAGLEAPETYAARQMQGRKLTPEEVLRNMELAGAGGAAVKSLHLAGGAAVDKALETSLPWRMAQALKTATPEGKMLPADQLSAAHVIEREAEIDATNPYQNSYQGIGAHRERIDSELQRIAAATPPPTMTATAAPPAAGMAPRLAPVAAGAGRGFLNDSIVEGLLRRGLTETQARGVAAGIHAESKSDPGALGPLQATTGHRALGLGQWLGPRLEAITARYGPRPTLDQQLDFLVEELKGGHPAGAKVLGQKDPAAVLRSYIEDFMVPGAPGSPDVVKDIGRGMEALGLGGEEAPATGAPGEPEPLPPVPELDAPGPSAAAVAAREEPGAAPAPAPPTTPDEPLQVRPEVTHEGLVPVVRQIIADRGQRLDVEKIAAALEVEPHQVRRALDELVQNGELHSNREDLRLKAERVRRAANAASGAARKGTDKIKLTAAAPIDEAAVTYRRRAQPAANRGGDNLLQFISRHGGISEDGLNDAGRVLGTKGHDLKETHQKWVPGHGPLIRKTGLSIDDMGERLWGEGYFGPPEVTPRPSEAEVLGAIERSIKGEKIHSFYEDGPPPAAKASDFAPPDPDKVTSDEALVQTYQTWDAVAAHVGLADRFSLAEIDHAREIMARGTDSLPPLDKPEGEASPEELAPYLLEAVNRDIPTGETELDGDLQGAAVDSEEPTYEHYAAAAAQVDAAADRGGSRPAAPEAGPGREGAAGSQGDAGDKGAAQGVERPGQAGAVPGGERLPAAESAAGRGGEPVTGATPDLTGAERDAANAAGNLGPVILDSEGLKAFDDPTGAPADKAADDAWHDIQAAAEAKKPPAAKRKKGDENPLVRRGDTVTLTQDVDYLRAGETYTIERGNKKEAYFRNAETGGGTFLQNWTLKRALNQGHMKIEPHEAPAEIPAAGHAASPEGAARPPEAGAPPAEAPAALAARQGEVRPSDPATVDILKLMAGAEDDGKYAPVDGSTQRVRMLLDEGLAAVDPQSGRVVTTAKGRALIDAAEAPPAAPSLDLGEQVDPNLAAKQRQELDLAAQQPLRGARKTGAAQEEVMPEGLFGGKIEPRMLAELEAKGLAVDLGDGKGLRPVEEIHAELEDDAKAIDTIASCILPGKGGTP
jgi:hypothetical protein